MFFQSFALMLSPPLPRLLANRRDVIVYLPPTSHRLASLDGLIGTFLYPCLRGNPFLNQPRGAFAFAVGLIALALCLALVASGIMFWACRKKPASGETDDDVRLPRTPLHPPSKLPSAAQYAENLRARPTSPRVVPHLEKGDETANDTPTARELLRQPSSSRSVRTSYSKR